MDIEKNIIVGPTDTDSYNIIHHPVYFIWTEQAILQWLLNTYKSLDLNTYKIEKIQSKFITPGKLYDELILYLHPKKRNERIQFQGRIINVETKKLLVEINFWVRIEGRTNE